MDARFQQLVSDSQLLIAITGNQARDCFELAIFTGSLKELTKRADFVGLIGLKGFVPKLALAVELDETAMQALWQVFARLMEGAVERAEYWLSHDFATPPAVQTN